MSLFRWLRRAVRYVLHPCHFGCHDWSMPGGWCMDCGLCDRFFGPSGHERCAGGKCRHWIPPAD